MDCLLLLCLALNLFLDLGGVLALFLFFSFAQIH
jgi:hypothetical protein